MTENPRPHTHTAFILKREGKRQKVGRWLECGIGRIGTDGVVNVYLDRLPVGGFSGHVCLAPVGAKPPQPEPEPQRPGEDDEEAAEG